MHEVDHDFEEIVIFFLFMVVDEEKSIGRNE